MSFTLTVTGIEEAITGISVISANLKINIQTNVTAAFEKGVEIARKECPVKTGHLKSTIELKQGGDSENILAQIIISAGYAGFVNFGTFQHPPKPFATNGYYAIVNALKNMNLFIK